MANNCLITKLKGVVNNDNLKEYGSVYITAPANLSLTPDKGNCIRFETFNVNIKSVNSITFDVYNYNGTTLIAQNQTSYDVPFGNSIMFKADGIYRIYNKYNGIGLRTNDNLSENINHFVTVDLGSLNYAKCGYLSLYNVSYSGIFKVHTADWTSNGYVSLSGIGNYHGLIDFSGFVDASNANDIKSISCRSVKLSLPKESLKTLKNLQSLFLNSSQNPDGIMFGYELSDVFDEWVSNGRNTGSCQLHVNLTLCTINGNSVPNNTYIDFDPQYPNGWKIRD